MLKAWMGIDPGAKGAVALIGEGLSLVEDFTDEPRMAKVLLEWLWNFDIVHALVEQVGAMPGQGVTSMFSFGRNFGFWLGCLSALSIAHTTIRPQAWQKGLIPAKAQASSTSKPSRAAGVTHGKDGALAVAGRMFPGVSLVGPRGGAKDGRADALLLAVVCKRTHPGS